MGRCGLDLGRYSTGNEYLKQLRNEWAEQQANDAYDLEGFQNAILDARLWTVNFRTYEQLAVTIGV